MKGLTKIFNKHMLMHAGFMLVGMVFPMVAVAASSAGASATLGDVALGGIDMFFSMIFDGFEALVEVTPDLIENTINGDFAASSYEMGNMHEMYEMHEAGGHANHMGHMDHTVHNQAGAVSSDFSAAAGHDHSAHVEQAVRSTNPVVDGGAGVETVAPESLQKTFSSRSEWFEALPAERQKMYSDQATMLGISLEEATSSMCNPLIPKNW